MKFLSRPILKPFEKNIYENKPPMIVPMILMIRTFSTVSDPLRPAIWIRCSVRSSQPLGVNFRIFAMSGWSR